MRRLLIIAVMVMAAFTCYSQVSLSKEQLRMLPDSVRLSIQKVQDMSEMDTKMKELSESATIGQQIGEAVNGTLSAIEGSVMRVADSNLGKTAIAITVWKLLWRDIMGIVIGLIILTLGSIFCTKMMKAIAKTPDGVLTNDSVGCALGAALIFGVSCIVGLIAIFS